MPDSVPQRLLRGLTAPDRRLPSRWCSCCHRDVRRARAERRALPRRGRERAAIRADPRRSPTPPSATSSTSRPACAATCSPATSGTSSRIEARPAALRRALRDDAALVRDPAQAARVPRAAARRRRVRRRLRGCRCAPGPDGARALAAAIAEGKRELDALRAQFDDFNRAETRARVDAPARAHGPRRQPLGADRRRRRRRQRARAAPAGALPAPRRPAPGPPRGARRAAPRRRPPRRPGAARRSR